MSFQIENPIRGTLRYNYYRTTIHQYKNTIVNSGYIKAPIQSRSNEPNVVFLEKEYTAKSISIVRSLQVINGLSYDATLIIEHKSITNDKDPFFVCIPLKYTDGIRSELDDFINGKPNIDIVLNSIIDSNRAILYDNKYSTNSMVAVFTRPILIGSIIKDITAGDIYIAPYSDKHSTIAVEPILGSFTNGSIELLEGFIEGNETMAGYCIPISETDPSIKDTANIMLDSDSQLLANTTINTTLSTASNFFGFFLLMLFSVFATPAAYRYLLLELVLDNETFDSQMKLNRMSAVDMATSIIFFSFSLSFINYGIANGSTGSLLTGFYVFLFFLTSLIVLQYKRIFNEKEYLEQFGTGTFTPSFKDVRNDMGGLIFDNIRELFYKKTLIKIGTDTKSINTFSSSGILLLIVYIILYLGLYANDMLKTKGSFYFISIPVAFFFLAWYIAVLVNHWWYVYTQNGMKPNKIPVPATN